MLQRFGIHKISTYTHYNVLYRENLEEIVKAIDQVDEKNNPRKICRQHLEFLKARRMERKLGIKLKLKHKSPSTLR